MPKPRTAPVVNLADFKKKLVEEHSVIIRTDEGDFRYRGPELLTDDEMRRMVELEGSTDPAAVLEVARIMMDDYDGFVAAGGSTAVLMKIISAEQAKRAKVDPEGERLGESGPPSAS
jgi:hypothetical protein